MSRTPSELANDKIYLVNSIGRRLGPFKAAVKRRAGKAEVFVSELDVAPNDKLVRLLSGNKEENYIVVDVHFSSNTYGEFASYELGIEKEGVQDRSSKTASQTINFYNSQGIQIGDYNIQNVIDMFEELAAKIEESDATTEEKLEAKNRLSAFLNHPIASSVLGGVSGSLVGRLNNP